jgi:hypothetical protein
LTERIRLQAGNAREIAINGMQLAAGWQRKNTGESTVDRVSGRQEMDLGGSATNEGQQK